MTAACKNYGAEGVMPDGKVGNVFPWLGMIGLCDYVEQRELVLSVDQFNRASTNEAKFR